MINTYEMYSPEPEATIPTPYRIESDKSVNVTVEMLVRVFDRLHALEKLSAGWDGQDAEPIARTAIGRAGQLAAIVGVELSLRSPGSTDQIHAVPMVHGGVQLEWDDERRHVEIEIDPDGTLSYLTVLRGDSGRRVMENDSVSVSQAITAVRRLLAM